jgi:hypothetical protein
MQIGDVEWRKIVGSIELSYLRSVVASHLKLAEEHDTETAKEWEKCKAISEQEKDEFGRSVKNECEEWVSEKVYENEQVQQILFKSFVLACCMLLEHELRGLCKHLKEEFKEKFSLSDIQGTGIKACLSYVETITEKPFLFGNQDFALLIELRNLVIHDNGAVHTDRQNALKSKYKGNSLGLDFHNNAIFVDKGTLPAYLALTETVMGEISNFWVYKESPMK